METNKTGSMTQARGSRTTYVVMTALFAALIAVCSWISFPLPFTQVPITLSTLGVMLAALLLGTKYGTFSVILYMAIGAVGVPVFSGFKGGLGHLAGPTGGYLVGYILFALVTGFIYNKFFKKNNNIFGIILACVVGDFFCYLLGTLWYMQLTNTGLSAALVMCVFPFLPGDAAKIIVAAILTKALKPRLNNVLNI